MKLTKKQEKAIEGLILNLDEINDRPRMLYDSLCEFANAFLKEDEYNNAITIRCLEELRDDLYYQLSLNGLIYEIPRSSKETIEKMLMKSAKRCKGKKEEWDLGYEKGVKDGIRTYSKHLMCELIPDY